MLATQRMSSHGGQLPFGYNPIAIQSIGLPEFLSPGEPLGQSILNDEESSTLNHFFSDFESDQPPQPMPLQFAPPPASSHQPLPYVMPPLYFGSETSDGTGPGIDPHTLHLDGQPTAYPNQPTYDLQILQVTENAFNQVVPGPTTGSGVDVSNNNNNNIRKGSNTSTSRANANANAGRAAANAGNSHSNNSSNQFDAPVLDRLHTAAANVQHPRPGFTSNWNQQPYQPQGMPLQTPGRGPIMRFGSDSHFTQSGFQLPNSAAVVDSEDATLNHWLPSAPNSRPPTQPNTQPSSPNWSKKRKLEDFNATGSGSRNGYHGVFDQGRRPSQHTPSLGQIKYESQPGSLSSSRMPGSNARRSDEHHPSDEVDAAAESDEDAFNSSLMTANTDHSPSASGIWPNKAAQGHRATSVDKAAKKRRKSLAPTTPTFPTTPYGNSFSNSSGGLASQQRPKSSPSSATMTAKTARASSTRVPLTTEQKKANHTNSEQRRRDATARAYAELYDLVPEVAEMGKQSTMKKLELVVDKVSWTIRAIGSLRAKLGIKNDINVDFINGHAGDGFVGHSAHVGLDGEICYPDLD